MCVMKSWWQSERSLKQRHKTREDDVAKHSPDSRSCQRWSRFCRILHLLRPQTPQWPTLQAKAQRKWVIIGDLYNVRSGRHKFLLIWDLGFASNDYSLELLEMGKQCAAAVSVGRLFVLFLSRRTWCHTVEIDPGICLPCVGKWEGGGSPCSILAEKSSECFPGLQRTRSIRWTVSSTDWDLHTLVPQPTIIFLQRGRRQEKLSRREVGLLPLT